MMEHRHCVCVRPGT